MLGRIIPGRLLERGPLSDLPLDPAAWAVKAIGPARRSQPVVCGKNSSVTHEKFFAMGRTVFVACSERAKAEGQFILFHLRLLSMRNTGVPHCSFADRG